MISAWDVYWVMQLDSIKGALTGLTAASFAALIFGVIFVGCHAGEDMCSWNREHATERQDFRRRMRRWMCWGAPFAITFLLALTLTPSTKTAAAMIVLPAVANSETIQSEAGDLYRLAKKALADAAGEDGDKPE